MRSLLLGLTLLTGASLAAAQEGGQNQLHYPLADELAGLLKAADAARAGGELEQAVDLYRMALDGDRTGNSGYQIASVDEGPARPMPGGQPAPRRYIGITEWAMQGLRALPADGVALFRARYDYRAGSALAEALAAPEPLQALARAYELYPISSHAARLLETLADLYLERGELDGAARALERLLRDHAADLQDPTRIRRKLLICCVGAGLPERVRELSAELLRDDPRGQLHLAAGPVTEQQLERLALEAQQRRAGRGEDARPALHHLRMDPENRACTDAKALIGPARFPVRTFELNGLGGGNASARPFAPGQLPQQPAPSRNLALLHGDHVFVVTADQVFAYLLRNGEEAQRIPRIGTAFPDPNPKVQFGGTIAQETLVVPVVDEVLRDQQYRGIPIKVKVPIRKLAGFDLGSWRWQWTHARLLDGTPLERWSFPAPPSSAEGVVFAPAFAIEGFVNSYVAAFDARTGSPLWNSWLVSGQVEQTMFGEQAVEPLCTPVAVHDGVVYHVTSFGCVAALDAVTGRILWVTEYDQLEVRPPRGYYADPRTITWEPNAPVVQSGVVIVTPLDSPKYYGIDARTGERLWETRQRASAAEGDMRYVLGACEVNGAGAVVLGGLGEVRCVGVRSGKLLWRAPLRGRLVSGRGVIASGPNGLVACVPVDRNEVFTFEVETGKRSQSFEVGATGNLAIAGDHVLVTGSGTLAVHRNGAATPGGGAPPPSTPPNQPNQRGQDF